MLVKSIRCFSFPNTRAQGKQKRTTSHWSDWLMLQRSGDHMGCEWNLAMGSNLSNTWFSCPDVWTIWTDDFTCSCLWSSVWTRGNPLIYIWQQLVQGPTLHHENLTCLCTDYLKMGILVICQSYAIHDLKFKIIHVLSHSDSAKHLWHQFVIIRICGNPTDLHQK